MIYTFKVDNLKEKKNEAAEEVCWTILLMMNLGLLEIPIENRLFLAKSMQKWSDIAYAMGDFSN